MNKLLIILIFFAIFFMAPPLFAEIHGQVEFGKDAEDDLLFTNLQLSLDFDAWIFNNTLYCGTECWMSPAIEMRNHPFLNLYTVGYTLEYEGVFVNVQHWCSHAVWSDQPSIIWKDTMRLGHNQTTFSVGYKW